MQESTETRFPTATTSPSPLLKGSQLSPQLRLVNPPCLIVYREMRFLLMDAPSELTVPLYIKEMHRHNVTDLVRDWIFPDGAAPPGAIVHQWLALLKRTFSLHAADSLEEYDEDTTRSTVAVHCIAGLGRAPVLIAIALIEHGMDPFDAVLFIRRKRRGAINQMQLKFLETYYHRHKRAKTAPRCSLI
ncbi:hypothetical protein MDAP_002300 [Mitosporidium daphniae]|uniref:Tyrosine specific protein phosphatases domain-containing protein n=1 Tax=Mitosporidium daphniae TaxID=1485682 RepID=A0A098VPV7_9MICR|nr:uncharacterized protein DI09_46p80 [Mitosporidium daphniae]KGG51058.1 hypothetical protein DI09_46p80 [Mitosporidium daphniae]|eukprot:XP_013237504.1 uncharacterized protein DI09_46p80 [Mitosporidium daphniae]